MTNTLRNHIPTEAFRSELEAQIARALRQHRPGGLRRNVSLSVRSMLAGVAASLAIGFVIGVAPAQLQESEQRSALISVAQSERRVAEMWVSLASEQMELMNRRVASGVAGREMLDSVRAELRAAETRLKVAMLNLEEVTISGRPVRNDLAAPLVGGRDFVKERLEPQLSVGRIQLQIAEHNLQAVRTRLALDLEDGVALQRAQMQLDRVQSASAVLVARMDLRDEFLANRISAVEMEKRVQIAELQAELKIAQQRLAISEANMQFVKQRVETGVAARGDLLRAELESLEQSALIEQIRTKLRMLGAAG